MPERRPLRKPLHEAEAARRDTLLLAKTSAALLGLTGCKPTEFSSRFSRPIYEERKKLLTRRTVRVLVGKATEHEVRAQGWKLTCELTSDGEHASTKTLLVLETSGTLAVVNRYSALGGSSGHGRERTINADPNSSHYPYLGITSTMNGYESPADQERLVQQRLASLVVLDGLHEGTVFARVFQKFADSSRLTR